MLHERELVEAARGFTEANSSGFEIESLPRIGSIAAAEVKWLVHGVIPENTSILLTGESGCGKSTLATAIGGCVANGANFAGLDVDRRRVLLMDRENPSGVVAERLNRLCMSDGPDFKIWGSFSSEEPCSPGGAIVQGWALANPGCLIVVDSALSFLEGDENSASDVKKFCSELRRLTALGATVLTLHHSSEKGTAKYRGSSYWRGGVDVAFHVTSSNPARLERLDLEPFKSRVAIERLSLKFDYSTGEFRPQCGETQSDRLMELLRRNPGIVTKLFEDLAAESGLGRNAARVWLERGVDGGWIDVERGSNNRKLHSLRDGA